MHFKSHQREAFEIAIHHLRDGGEWTDTPKELANCAGDGVAIGDAVQALWHCSDIMPGDLTDAVADLLLEDVMKRRTFGAAAQHLKSRYCPRSV